MKTPFIWIGAGLGLIMGILMASFVLATSSASGVEGSSLTGKIFDVVHIPAAAVTYVICRLGHFPMESGPRYVYPMAVGGQWVLLFVLLGLLLGRARSRCEQK